jgi:hypothetical protein
MAPRLVLQLPGRIAMQQNAPACAGGPLHGGELAQAFFGACKLDENPEHPIKRIFQFGRRPVRSKQIGRNEIHLHAASGSQLACFAHGNRGNFHRRQFQSLLCQPHRIAAFTVGHGKCGVSMLEQEGAARQEMIGFDADQIVVAGVAITGIPAGFIVHRASLGSKSDSGRAFFRNVHRLGNRCFGRLA